MFADVVLPQRRYRLFTYLVPPHLQGRLHIGSRVWVPLGRHLVYGLVFALMDRLPQDSSGTIPDPARLREIQGLVETPLDSPLDAEQIALAKRVTEYYLAPPASGLRLLLPPTAPRRLVIRYTLTEAGKQALQEARLSELNRRILAKLLCTPKGLTAATLSKTCPEAARALPRLARQGWIQAVESVSGQTRQTSRHPRGERRTPNPFIAEHDRSRDLEGSSDRLESQANSFHPDPNSLSEASDTASDDLPPWWDAFLEALAHHRHHAFLLYALRETRAKLLIRAIERSLAHRRSALVVVPEIEQAETLMHRLRSRFGARSAVFHSELTLDERMARWQAVRNGSISVVVGTHAALFLPLPALGLIWAEDEEAASFKAEHSPYYHARTVAEMRADLQKAVLILSTSHPSLETYHRFSIQPDSMWSPRHPVHPARRLHVVPLQDIPYGEVFSETMIQGMTRTLERGGRMILFVNRKGFSRALACRDCGHILRCRPCGVALIVYQHPRRLVCPYCSQSLSLPEICPACASSRWQSSGIGTERIESRARELFPTVPIARFDRDSIQTPHQEREVRQAFARGEIRILIGTELLIHTHPPPRAPFIGLPYADAGLHRPDFRSAERTYHVLTEVTGLAEEPAAESEIVMQTALPTHHVIQAFVQQNPMIFYEHELRLRCELGYPPFSQLVQITITGRQQAPVETAASAYASRLRAHLQKHDGRSEPAFSPVTDPVLGPIPATRSGRSTKHRWMILLKNFNHRLPVQPMLRDVGQECESLFKRMRVTCEINVDPVDIV